MSAIPTSVVRPSAIQALAATLGGCEAPAPAAHADKLGKKWDALEVKQFSQQFKSFWSIYEQVMNDTYPD